MPSGKFDQQPQVEDAKRKNYGTNIKTYSKGLASYLRSWTGVPRALFWCQNVYRELSQLPLRQLSGQKDKIFRSGVLITFT
jgi:hypothetical protein